MRGVQSDAPGNPRHRTRLVGAVSQSANINSWGELLLGASLATFTVSLRIMEPAEPPRPAVGSTRQHPWLNRYVGTAYCWLVVAGVLYALPALELIGISIDTTGHPALHTLTIGFLTMLIIGLAARLLPLFEHRTLPMAWLLGLAYAALASSTALRLLDAFVNLPSGALGIVGLIGAAGFMLGTMPILILLIQPGHNAPRPTVAGSHAHAIGNPSEAGCA